VGEIIPFRAQLWDRSGYLVSAEGLEPSTNGLKGHCSTIELRAHSGGDFITRIRERQRAKTIYAREKSLAFHHRFWLLINDWLANYLRGFSTISR
jgi:hypothetical protein